MRVSPSFLASFRNSTWPGSGEATQHVEGPADVDDLLGGGELVDGAVVEELDDLRDGRVELLGATAALVAVHVDLEEVRVVQVEDAVRDVRRRNALRPLVLPVLAQAHEGRVDGLAGLVVDHVVAVHDAVHLEAGEDADVDDVLGDRVRLVHPLARPRHRLPLLVREQRPHASQPTPSPWSPPRPRSRPPPGRRTACSPGGRR